MCNQIEERERKIKVEREREKKKMEAVNPTNKSGKHPRYIAFRPWDVDLSFDSDPNGTEAAFHARNCKECITLPAARALNNRDYLCEGQMAAVLWQYKEKKTLDITIFYYNRQQDRIETVDRAFDGRSPTRIGNHHTTMHVNMPQLIRTLGVPSDVFALDYVTGDLINTAKNIEGMRYVPEDLNLAHLAAIHNYVCRVRTLFHTICERNKMPDLTDNC